MRIYIFNRRVNSCINAPRDLYERELSEDEKRELLLEAERVALTELEDARTEILVLSNMHPISAEMFDEKSIRMSEAIENYSLANSVANLINLGLDNLEHVIFDY